MAGMAVLTVADTIARSFVLAVDKRDDKPAIREKKFGIWQPTSWRQWLEISKDIAYALQASGFRPGDVASILSNAVPEWVYADMGVLCAGGVSSGIYPTDSAVQVEYLINDSRTRIVFVYPARELSRFLINSTAGRLVRLGGNHIRQQSPALGEGVSEASLPE